MAASLRFLAWKNQWFSQLSIAQKIGYGYGLAIGIAVVGASIGQTVGTVSLHKAQSQFQVADSQYSIVNELTILTLTLRSHPQQLLGTLTDPIWFKYETSKYTNATNLVKETLTKLEVSVQESSLLSASERQQLQQLIYKYAETTQSYTELMTLLWKSVDPQTLTPSQMAQSPQRVLSALTTKEAIQLRIKFERLAENLTRLERVTADQKAQAYLQLERANTFQVSILIGSIVLSTAIATLLALLTSQAIAHPVKVLTHVAQQSIQESNFSLQAPITTSDEIGILARSFNQLIESVNQLLQAQATAKEQLEFYSHTLEHQVEERTQELKEKKHLLEELKRTQIHMIQSEKMSSLGQLVAGVAHEINNPVNFIHGNLSYVNTYTQDLLDLVSAYQQQYPHPPDALQSKLEEIDLDFLSEDLGKIVRSMNIGTDRIREIVQSLRNFSRLDEAELKAVDLHQGIDNTLLILQHRLKSTASQIQVLKDYGQLPPVECYPGQLNQVFMNLLANAIDAVEERITKTSNQTATVQPNIIQIKTDVIEQNQIVVTFSDTGSEIPEAIRSRLFDPFFTTKPVGKGTGLGLSISYQIVVEKHNGKISCESNAQGTKFIIQIPIRQPLPIASENSIIRS